MAETGEGFFGLFKKKAPEPVDVVVAGRETTLETPSQMVPLIVSALEARLQVQIAFGNAAFFSHFDWELTDGDGGKVTQSKSHLEEGQYLLLMPMEPPIGNLKVRSATDIRLEFASRSHLLECSTSLLQITPARKICLAFPKVLRQKPERRSGVRVLVDRTMTITLTVVRPSGIVFEAKFRNLSARGAAFFGTGAIPKIADHSQVEVTIVYPEGKLEVEANVLGAYLKDGEQLFRIQFTLQDQQVTRDIGVLTSYVQRSNIQRRNKLLQ
ncbi:MAG: PilZ domain-containing protein [Magnetococcus sp. DMHC-8]